MIAVGGVGIGLAWKTDVLDKILPPNIKEFFGKEVTTDGTPTNGEEPTDGEDGEPAEDLTKDWNSYSNEEFGFSFKYPESWDLWVGGAGPIELVTISSKQRITDENGDFLDFLENAIKIGIGHELGNYYRKPLREWLGNSFGSVSDVNFAGRMWVVGAENPSYLFTNGESGETYSVFIPFDPNNPTSDSELIEMIVSTIKLR